MQIKIKENLYHMLCDPEKLDYLKLQRYCLQLNY